MAMTDAPDMNMDASNLYREDVYTDQRVGTLRVLTPLTPEGETDTARAVQYMGSAQLMTPAGALPISFEIEAANLADAIAGFGAAAEVAVEQTVNELREMQREAASSIVVPKGGQVPGGGGFGGPGGGIQMP